MFRAIFKNTTGTLRRNQNNTIINSTTFLNTRIPAVASSYNNNTSDVVIASNNNFTINNRSFATKPTKTRDPTYKHYGKHLKNRLYTYGMKQGKKETVRKHILKTMKEIQKTSTYNHVDLLKLSIINNAPLLKIKSIKRNRSVREFPYIIKKENRIGESIKSIYKTIGKSNKASSSSENNNLKVKNKYAFYNKLKDEIISSSSPNNINTSMTVKSKIEKQDDALKLKKFAHYRWLE